MAGAIDDPSIDARRARGIALLKEAPDEGRPGVRVAVLGTFNLDLVGPFLADALDRVGLRSSVVTAPVGQLGQWVVDPGSSLYAAPRDAVVLVPAPDDLIGDTRQVEEAVSELREQVMLLLERLPAATLYPVVFGADRLANEHVLDPSTSERGQVAAQRFSDGVRDLAALSERVVVIDWEWHVRGTGRDVHRDARLWYLARMRLGQRGAAAFAELVAEHVAAARGAARKVCVVDLDGVLWGGVVGEDGLTGIEVGEDGVGLAFRDFQRELLALRAAGTLLVACSKNEERDALEALDHHAGMLLRREHLAGYRINWQDKATNLRELAEELSLGLDAFVFLDDSTFERDWVRASLPEVIVPELPADPSDRPAFLRAAPWFRRVRVTEADALRAESYRNEAARRSLREESVSLDGYISSLGQRVTIEPVASGTLGRAAQLTQRTNQFNLTTERLTVAEIEERLADPSVGAWTVALSDRFGSSGIIGLVIARFTADEAVIDTLLLSCRVLGRRLEDAVLAFVAAEAADRGSRTLVGRFLPTDRNAQVASFYPDRAFTETSPGIFHRALEHGLPAWPAAVTREETAGV